MKQTHVICIVLVSSIFSLAAAAWSTVTTPSAAVGEDVVWSLSNVSSSQISFQGCVDNANPGFDPTAETCIYTAPTRSGSAVTVEVDIPNLRQLVSDVDAAHQIWVNIPDRGVRWVTKLRWDMDGGAPQPTTLSLDHRARFDPYQAVPAYPSYPDDGWPDYQPDKQIIIQVATFTVEEGVRTLYIYILPSALVGIDSPEQNGLPRFARTEPDTKYKKPFGCNGCSDMGLPGYRVNMANLLPVFQDTLYKWAGRGPAVDLALSWNANVEAGATNFGTGWRFSYDSWLIEASEGATIEQGSGATLNFAIPADGNANVSSVTPLATGDVEVEIAYQGGVVEPSYSVDWDGAYTPERSGYRLKKDLNGDPSMVTFILTPPEEKLSYIYQAPINTPGPLPLTAVEDWNGNRLQIARNGSGAVTAVTDSVGRSAVLSYTNGQCTQMTLPGGMQVAFSYSGDDLVRVVDLIGNQTDYSYDSNHLITGMNTEGRLWQFGWAAVFDTDYLESVIDPDGRETRYDFLTTAFDLRKTQITDATGRSFIYEYPNGQYRKNSRAMAPTVSSDERGRPVTIQQKDSSVARELEYNEIGAISRITEFDGGVHTYIYNDRGQVTEYVDALGNSWQSDYDAYGNLIGSESPAGRTYQLDYDAYGQLVRTIDPEGNEATITYDAYGNMQTLTDGEGSTTTFGYDANGIELTSVTDPLGRTTTFAYDANRRQTRVTHPDGSYLEMIYDCCSAIGLRNENGDLRSVSRSASLNILSDTDFMGNTSVYSYDSAGRQVMTADPEGRTTTASYNNLGQLTAVQGPDGDSTEWWYYSNTDELFFYTLSKELGVQVPVSLSWRGGPYQANDYQYVRDKMGRLRYIKTPRSYSKFINYNWDADGLLSGKDFNGEPIATFSRNFTGSLLSTTHQLGTDTYTRNGRNQVVRQTWYDGLSMDSGYDVSGQLSTLTYPDGSTASYSYDSRGRITDISWKGASLQTQYDAVGNITAEFRSNGVNSAVNSDRNGQLTRVRHFDGSLDLFDLQCTRNSRGLIDSCTKSGEAAVWVPALARVNTSSTYAYNHSFTLTAHDGASAATDAAGNQSVIPGSRAFAGTFDYQDLLTSWTTSSGAHQAVYDGQGRLVQWIRGEEVRRFHYDDADRLLFETDDGNNITAMWLYRGGQIVAMADGAGLYFYHNDLSANVAFLTDTEAQVAAAYRYLPFGLQTGSWSGMRNPFTFVGSLGVIDLGDGLYHMRTRTYDALTRAFLSNDPLGLGVSPNAREYARNNPVNYIDPDGRWSLTSQYSSEGATGPRIGADMNNKVYNAPTMNYEAPRGGDGCSIIGPAVNALIGSTRFGNSFSALMLLKHLRNGEWENAADDVINMGISAISGPAGLMSNFIYVPNGGNRPSPYEVTFPEFSLEN